MTEPVEQNIQESEEVIVDLNKNENDKQQNEEPQAQSSTVTNKVVPAKKIVELTDEDKQILISNARAGIDNPNFDVKIFKNGNTRICKKKKPTVSQQAVSTNGERVIKDHTNEQKVYMTDNQLIWEHLFELETKYQTLYNKHRKLKQRYNDLYIEDETPTTTPTSVQQQDQQQYETSIETPTPVQQQQIQNEPQIIYQQQQPMNWRTALRSKNRILM